MDRQELRERRRRLGLTQAQLAEALGVSARAIGKWEAGDAPITFSIDLATRYLLKHRKNPQALSMER